MQPIQQPILKFIAIVLTAFAGLFAPLQTAIAAEKKAQSVPGVKAPPVKPVTLSDARLKAFAIASSRIMEIRQKYWPQVQAADTEDAMRKIAATAQKEMMQAISAQGMTVVQYNGIVQAVQEDKALIKRIKKLEKDMKPTKK